MATVQNVQQNKRTNYTMPAFLCGALIGGLAGAYVPNMPLVPVKYKTTDELIEAMTAKDKFEINLPSNASTDAKNASTSFKDAATKIDKQVKRIFKDKTELTLDEFKAQLDDFEKEFFDKAIEHHNVIKKLDSLKIDETINTKELLDLLSSSNPVERGKISEILLLKHNRLNNTSLSQLPEQYRITPEDKEIFRIFKRNTRDRNTEILCNAFEKNKKLSQNEFKQALKTSFMPKNAKEMFKTLKEYLPKSKIEGAIIWGGICAYVFSTIASFMSNVNNTKEKH